MTHTIDAIAWFSDLGAADVAEVGGKGANLGELANIGLPVPDGFVITASEYQVAMADAHARHRLRDGFAEALSVADDTDALARHAARLRAMVREAGVPDGLRDQIVDAYHRLGELAVVAVRSSATAEHSTGISFAGMHETYNDVVGAQALVDRVVDCWASLYGDRAIAYRASQGMNDEPSIAVVVQRLVPADRAGVMFTANPSTGDRSQIVVEAAFGLGDVVVSGEVEPDTYVLAKDGSRIIAVRIGHKARQLVAHRDGSVERLELDDERADSRVLADHEVVELGLLALDVERHYGEPQDIEWAIACGSAYLLGTRSHVNHHGDNPMTTTTPIDIGIDEPDRLEIADGLAHLLADTYTLYLKTHNYHWNVTGPMFQTLHLMFETQYTELALAVDQIAERIRALGVPAPASYQAFGRLSSIAEDDDLPDATEMIRRLVQGQEAVVRTARSVFSVAGRVGDEPTADLLTQRMQVHEKTAWMLRSLLT